MKKIALIGSTGSIGCQVLNVVRRHPDKFQIVSMAGGNNHTLFAKQIKEFNPNVATIISKEGASFCKEQTGISVMSGENAFINAIIEDADVVVIALVGFKGLIAVLDAIKKGKNIALANKESLVVGGCIVMDMAKERGVKIVPIDSEHSAIWQALDFDFTKPFNKLILTASGGAFRDFTIEELKYVRAKDALKHPNWSMGAKITVDCATMVNKGFEVIEAKWLYNTSFDKIDVIIHKESIIHSLVEFVDGSTIAQMSYPTMELPIQIALTYPERFNCDLKGLNLAELGNLSFKALDRVKYPCFDLVVNSSKAGAVYSSIVNGANEVAVNLFLQDKLAFNDIYTAIDSAVQGYKGDTLETEENLFFADAYARDFVIKKFSR